ncbi:ABC transporter ATP-binding protein [Halegenticoccus tardaugens]|uniref:ABC transporter ATP-binding protein n=1 Tax=Halegenticoccus tardaugens TaxID=2071624 RepID=UPI00100A4735|nr:sn-glycerol-3-phosphate ABC transporter ATP-binding protein UgpC [Halegenticoccus tardaugens]
MGELNINHLTKVFGDDDGEIVAVDDLDIAIEDGEFLVLVGPSGCGKSTTLRCVAGLESVTSGNIILDDESVTNRKPKDRNMAMVFQNYALYPHMTAQENMGFGLKMTTNLSKAEINQRVEDTAKMMGISELLDDRPGNLSGGQQQRVALGRAIVREPEVFLMDEPLSNLDAKLRTQMRTELQELQQHLDVTTIYVTHDQTEAMTMGDRIAVLNRGELQQIGTPLECYHQPNNRFVAGFIGSPSMNFLAMRWTGQTLEHTTFEYHLSEQTMQQVRDMGVEQVTLGIRPEDIQPEANDPNAITITVNVTEPLGDMTYVYFDIGDTACTASVPGDLSISEGDRLSVTFPQDRIHIFDGNTGKVITNRTFRPTDKANQSVNT